MISQPRYLPALSYLQRIHHCDFFIILDTVQHNRQDLEHRNRIANHDTAKWLSLPLDRSNGTRVKISNLQLLNNCCLEEHFEQLEHAYHASSHFNSDLLKHLYAPIDSLDLTFNLVTMMKRSFEWLGLVSASGQHWLKASELDLPYAKGPNYLVNLCKHVGALDYISGPNGKSYISNEFTEAGLRLFYHCDDPPVYDRGKLPPLPWLAWIDAYFHQGPKYVRDYILGPMNLVS